MKKRKAILNKGTFAEQNVTVIKKLRNGEYLIRRKSFLSGKFIIDFCSSNRLTFK